MNRWFAVVPLVVLVALAAMFAGWSLKRETTFKPQALVGQGIPMRVLPILENGVAGPQTENLKGAAAGRPMIVNVFASWCAPCRVEHPRLIELQAQGIRIVGVAYKDQPEAAQAFLDELGNPFSTVLFDKPGDIGLDLGISGVPETFVVDATGTIIAKKSGPIIDEADLKMLNDALSGRVSKERSPLPILGVGFSLAAFFGVIAWLIRRRIITQS